MTKARRTEGPRAPLFFFAASIAFLLSSSPTWSQTVDLSALELCAELETAELKLRCFEAIIASGKAGTVEETAAAKSRPVAPSPMRSTAAPATAGAPGGAGAPKLAASVPAAPVSVAAPASAESNSPAGAVASASAEDEFGQEYLVRPAEEPEKADELLHATVVDVSKGRNDILYFRLDNGQLWRQNEARYYAYPKNGQFEVDISRGMMGEYRMRIGDNSRMVRIRRVE